MAAISAFDVTQHSQIFHFSSEIEFNSIQLHNSQPLLNLRYGYFRHLDPFCVEQPINHPVVTFKGSSCDKKKRDIIFAKSQPPFDVHRQHLDVSLIDLQAGV